MTREALYEADDILTHYLRIRLDDIPRDNFSDRFSTQSYTATAGANQVKFDMPDGFQAVYDVTVNGDRQDHAFDFYADIRGGHLVFPGGLSDGDNVAATVKTGEPWIRPGDTDRSFNEQSDFPAVIVNLVDVSQVESQGIGSSETRDVATFQVDTVIHKRLEATFPDGTSVLGSDIGRELKRRVDQEIRRLKSNGGPQACGLKLTDPNRVADHSEPFDPEPQHQVHRLEYQLQGNNIGQP